MTIALGRARAGVAAAFFAQGYGLATVLTHLIDFKSRWGIDDLGITLLLFAVAVLAGVGSSLIAVLAARRDNALALRAALGVAALGLAGLALAPTRPLFVAALVAYGLGLGGVDAGSNMQAVGLENRYRRSILTSFHGSWSGGGVLASLAVAAADRAGVALAVTVLAAAAVAGLAAAGPLLARPAGADVPAPPVPAAVPWRPLLLLGVALVLFYLADSAASTWSTIYLRDGLTASAGVAPLAYGAYQATSLAARFAGDLLVRRYGAVAVVRVAAATAAAGLVLVVLAPGPWPAVAGFAVLGAGVAVVAPLTFSAAGALAAGEGADQARGRDAVVARLNLFNYAGFVLGGVLTGLVGSSSLRWGFVVPLTGVLLIVPLASAFAVRRTAVRTASGG